MLHLDLVQPHIRRSLILAPCIRSFVRHLPMIQYVTDCNLLTNDSSLTRNGSERERSDLVYDNIEWTDSRESLSILALRGGLHCDQIG